MMKCFLLISLCCALGSPGLAGPLKINGSTTVNLPAAEVAEELRARRGMEIQIDTQGGSSGGISALGYGRVQIGMSSRPLSDDDLANYPDVDFGAIQVGEDAVAMVVSSDVWEGGVRVISMEQMRGIYEGKIRNWKEAVGPDQRIAFFNKEPGRGTWEVFAKWAYGDPKKAPNVSFPEVGGNEEARNKVASTRGAALSQLSSSWADNQRVYALAVELPDGTVIEPTPANIATRKYPLSRPLFLITNGEPSGDVKAFVEYMLSARGQDIVRRHGYLGLADLEK